MSQINFNSIIFIYFSCQQIFSNYRFLLILRSKSIWLSNALNFFCAKYFHQSIFCPKIYYLFISLRIKFLQTPPHELHLSFYVQLRSNTSLSKPFAAKRYSNPRKVFWVAILFSRIFDSCHIWVVFFYSFPFSALSSYFVTAILSQYCNLCNV